MILSCSDSDAALRALLPAFPEARDIEVTGAGLEEAFLQLTGDNEGDASSRPMSICHLHPLRAAAAAPQPPEPRLLPGFPIVMYFLLAAPNRNNHNFGGDASTHTGLFAPQYYMVGLLAFGTMVAVLSGGARIAAERTIGWNRLLRLTPLTARGYLRTKVLTGYLMAGLSIVLLYAAGIAARRSAAVRPRGWR